MVLVRPNPGERAPADRVTECAEGVSQERNPIRLAVRLDGPHDVARQPVQSFLGQVGPRQGPRGGRGHAHARSPVPPPAQQLDHAGRRSLERCPPDHGLSHAHLFVRVPDDAREVLHRFLAVRAGRVPGGEHDFKGHGFFQPVGAQQKPGHGQGEVVPSPLGRHVAGDENRGGEFSHASDKLSCLDLGRFRISIVPDDTLPAGVHRRVHYRLAPRGTQLDEHPAVQALELAGLGTVRNVPPVAAGVALPARRQRGKEKPPGHLGGLRCVQVHVHEPPGRLAEYEAHVLRPAVKVPRKFLESEEQALPASENGTLFAGRDGHHGKATTDVTLGGSDHAQGSNSSSTTSASRAASTSATWGRNGR
jgi:hypothetical protein